MYLINQPVMYLSFLYILFIPSLLAQSGSIVDGTSTLNAENLEIHDKEDHNTATKNAQETWSTDTVVEGDEIKPVCRRISEREPPISQSNLEYQECRHTPCSELDTIKPMHGVLSTLTSPTSAHSCTSASSTRAFPAHSPTNRQ